MSPMYHRLEVYVLDFDNYGIGDIIATLDRLDSYHFKVADHQTTVIPNWEDSHELNKTNCPLKIRRKYFDIKQVGTYVDVPLREKTELEKENEKLKEEINQLKNKLHRIKDIL